MKKLDVFYNIMIKNITILLFCLISALLSAKEVVIWATTDIHGVLLSKNGGMARILSILEEKRAPQDILIDAGDLFQGSYVANTSAGSIVVNAFNLMNYDFYIPGNHEFEFGSSILRRNFERMNCNILCANWKFVPHLAKMKPYMIIERNDMRIAIIGAGERESRCRILPDKNLSFTDEEKSIALALKDLRKEKVDLIVLVRHGGIYFKGGSLYSMMHKFPEIDLVIGGHSHQIERGRKIAGTYYVQPGMLAQGIAEIRVRFNERTRKIERITSMYHDAKNELPSCKMSAIIAEEQRLMKEARRKLNVKIPNSVKNSVDLYRYLLLQVADRIVPADGHLYFVENPDIALSSKLSRFLLYKMFPYENCIVTVPLTLNEYKIILNECRKYADKYKIKMLTAAPKTEKSFIFRTTSFVLSGGGRNFPESRRIAERKIKYIKMYPSVRQCVIDALKEKR